MIRMDNLTTTYVWTSVPLARYVLTLLSSSLKGSTAYLSRSTGCVVELSTHRPRGSAVFSFPCFHGKAGQTQARPAWLQQHTIARASLQDNIGFLGTQVCRPLVTRKVTGNHPQDCLFPWEHGLPRVASPTMSWAVNGSPPKSVEEEWDE